MHKIQLSKLKVTKMTSKGWVATFLSESPYYESMRALCEEEDRIKAKNIFIHYIRDMFLYDARDGKICEISWNRFLDMYELMETHGLKGWEKGKEKTNKFRIDSNMEIHDGQHRLAIWYAMGNEYIYIDDFWNPER